MMMNGSDKTAVLAKICTINAVEGFDPGALAVDYIDMNTGETRTRLPVMAQIAWFRLRYPEGRFTLTVTEGKGCFIAAARVYAHYNNPVDNYLSEATASRAGLQSKPSVSAREWAQTAALGIALRNAGFGLQFNTAGEGFDEVAVNELKQPAPFNLEPDNVPPTPLVFMLPDTAPPAAAASNTTPAITPPNTAPPVTAPLNAVSPVAALPDITVQTAAFPEAAPQINTPFIAPTEDPIDAAMKTPCPIAKFKSKTLGDLISLDPNALTWIATKYTKDPAISGAARLICEQASLCAAN